MDLLDLLNSLDRSTGGKDMHRLVVALALKINKSEPFSMIHISEKEALAAERLLESRECIGFGTRPAKNGGVDFRCFTSRDDAERFIEEGKRHCDCNHCLCSCGGANGHGKCNC